MREDLDAGKLTLRVHCSSVNYKDALAATREASVPAAWAVRLLGGLSPLEAMALGTAGFAAGLPVLRTEDNGLAQAHGPVVVSGPTGGVGSLATSVLTSLGYEVVAFTRKAEEEGRGVPALARRQASCRFRRSTWASPARLIELRDSCAAYQSQPDDF